MKIITERKREKKIKITFLSLLFSLFLFYLLSLFFFFIFSLFFLFIFFFLFLFIFLFFFFFLTAIARICGIIILFITL